MILVYYNNEIWVLEMELRESLFIELKSIDPDRMVIISKRDSRHLVKISELQTASEWRLL